MYFPYCCLPVVIGLTHYFTTPYHFPAPRLQRQSHKHWAEGEGEGQENDVTPALSQKLKERDDYRAEYATWLFMTAQDMRASLLATATMTFPGFMRSCRALIHRLNWSSFFATQLIMLRAP